MCFVLPVVPPNLLVGCVILTVGHEWQAALVGLLLWSYECGLNCWH